MSLSLKPSSPLSSFKKRKRMLMLGVLQEKFGYPGVWAPETSEPGGISILLRLRHADRADSFWQWGFANFHTLAN